MIVSLYITCVRSVLPDLSNPGLFYNLSDGNDFYIPLQIELSFTIVTDGVVFVLMDSSGWRW